MTGILSNILVWVVGLIILAVIVALVNLLIRLINRLIKGAEQIEGLILVCIRETIDKYAPDAIPSGASGGTQINMKRAISKLFPDVMSDRKLEHLATSGKLFLCLQTPQDRATSVQQAIEKASRAISQSSIPRERLQKAKVYSATTKNTEAALKAYLVIVGYLPTPPIQFKIGS